MQEFERNVLSRTTMAIAATLAWTVLLAGCSTYSSFGFPVEEGDIGAGRDAFVAQGCHRCHSVAGVPLPGIALAISPPIELGGETSRLKAYSELVTSIINPDHRISDASREQLRRSNMGAQAPQMSVAHIDTMTLRELIDVVAFLDSRYILIDDYQYDFVDAPEEDF